MPLRSIRYNFKQRFDVSALDAFKWCTSYDPQDLSLMEESGKRSVEWLSKDAVILTDKSVMNGKTFAKKKLVRLNSKGLSWTNTHIAGPVKFSQFLYQIVPEGKNASRLEFTGLQLENVDSAPDVRKLAKKYGKEDSAAWKLLAKAMHEELRK